MVVSSGRDCGDKRLLANLAPLRDLIRIQVATPPTTMVFVTLTPADHMRALVEEWQLLEDKLRAGGGPSRIEKQHAAGKLTARERISKLIDPGSMFLEIGLLMAYDKYDGQAPAAGVVTGLARIEGRPSVIVANDATVR